MCTQCAYQVWETSVRAGGTSAAPALAAAAATSVGARGLARLLVARGFTGATRRRVTVATAVLVSLTVAGVLLASAQRVPY